MKIDSIVFDCIDAAPLARFWSAALGWSVAPYDEDELARLRDEGVTDPEDDPSVLVEPPEDSDLPTLFFTEVPEDKMVKNRVHLDLVADTAIEDDVERLRGLGATLRNWSEEGGSVWAVMLDPEGNEFCVLPPEEYVAWLRAQNRPTVRPCSSMSTPMKAGVLPRPGIRCMSPQSATTKPAPALGTRLRTGSRKPVGRLSSVGSCDSDRWVFAMQTGSVPNPSASIRARSFSACGRKSTPSAP